MAKPSIYTVNTSQTTVETNNVLPLGNVVKRPCNRNIMLSGSNTINIIDKYENYYDIVVSATFTAADAGDVTLTLLQNNVPVIGGTATQTITTADTQVASISFKSTIRSSAGCNVDQIQILNAGIPATFSNISINIIKN